MANPIQILTGPPPTPITNPNTPLTQSVKNYVDLYFIRKTEFSKDSETTTCYVLDGGDSTEQPCDES